MGLLLAVVVHSAGIQDRAGARALLIRLFLRFECLKTIFAMAGLHRQPDQLGAEHVWLEHAGDQALPATYLFRVLPKRWVVERTFAWLSQSRRLSKDYKVSVASAEAFIKIACIRRMVRLLG